MAAPSGWEKGAKEAIAPILPIPREKHVALFKVSANKVFLIFIVYMGWGLHPLPLKTVGLDSPLLYSFHHFCKKFFKKTRLFVDSCVSVWIKAIFLQSPLHTSELFCHK